MYELNFLQKFEKLTIFDFFFSIFTQLLNVYKNQNTEEFHTP